MILPRRRGTDPAGLSPIPLARILPDNPQFSNQIYKLKTTYLAAMYLTDKHELCPQGAGIFPSQSGQRKVPKVIKFPIRKSLPALPPPSPPLSPQSNQALPRYLFQFISPWRVPNLQSLRYPRKAGPGTCSEVLHYIWVGT